MSLATPASRPAAPSLVVPALIACYLVWGSTYLAIRYALESFPPFFQMGTRFLTAGVLLLAWEWTHARRSGRPLVWPTGEQWRNALVVGTLMLACGMGLCATAEQTIGSGLIAAFVAVSPMLMCLWGLLFGQRPTRLEFAGMVVGVTGVFLLVRGASFSGSPFGVACIAGASLAWSLASVLSTTKMRLADGGMGYASEMLCGGAVLMVFSLVLGEQVAWPASANAVLAWAYLVVFGSLIAFTAYFYLLAHTTPAVASSYAFVNPVIALFLGVVVASETVTNGEWIACGVILAGVFLIFRGKTAAKAP